MQQCIIARYGEIHLKGANRGWFVGLLTKNLKSRIENLCKIKFEHTRFVFTDFEPKHKDEILNKVSQTFGIVSVSLCSIIPHNQILSHLSSLEIVGSFKVNVNRADKTFTQTSMEFAKEAGAKILESSPEATVDLHTPRTTIHIDIRENFQAYIYTDVISAVGGMPVGSSGRGLVMLSGGIDSPVAAYLSAKRGLQIDCIHFASPPFTSEFALDKVKRLAQKVGNYCGKVRIFVVPFTEIQEQIRKQCDPNYTITIMRRYMVRIAEAIATRENIDCIITGESLAQVASQTIQGITTTNDVAKNVPILRPLITYDKSEIISLAKKIDTYDISIEPHQDCCTVFVPEKPAIKPTIYKCQKEETKLDSANLIEKTINNTNIIE